MRVLNYGSLNVDYTYSVPHIIVGGETMASFELHEYCGGKGLNQSIALAKAGLDVWHAGIVGNDGQMLLDACADAGVHADFIKKMDVRGGHTVIQVDANGQNSIILYGGTNMMQTPEYVDEVLAHFEEGDYLVLQNEINLLDYIQARWNVKGGEGSQGATVSHHRVSGRGEAQRGSLSCVTSQGIVPDKRRTTAAGPE